MYYNYHDGPSAGLILSETIIKDNPTYVDSLNVIECALDKSLISPVTSSIRNMRNIMMFLNNYTTNEGGYSELNQTYLDKNLYDWKGWFNAGISWSDIENYIDELITIFPNADATEIKTRVETEFNSVSGGAKIPYVHLGSVIDELTLAFPTYNPDYGTNIQFSANACETRSDIKITSCTNAYDDRNIKVDCYGLPPFSFELKDENNNILLKIEGDSAPSYMINIDEVLATPSPSVAKTPVPLSSSSSLVYIDNFSNGNGYTRLNAHLSVVELEEPVGQTVSKNEIEPKYESTNIYPNPIQIGDNLFFDENFNSIEIFNSFGQLVYFNSDLNSIQITNDKFSPGIYFIRLDNKLSSQKLIVTK